jgi:mRNA interferase MazF
LAEFVKRGDIITVSARGDYGKPRPGVIVQSDLISSTDSVLVALITSSLTYAPLLRLTIEPNPENKLKVKSQVMIDKILAFPRSKCGKVIGRLNNIDLLALNQLLSVIFGLAD